MAGSRRHAGPGKPPRKGRKPELVRRAEAVAKTQGRFAGKVAKLGSNDCVKMLRFHLAAMGHKGLPSTGHYSTLLQAKRALKARAGASNLEELCDGLLERIAPAAMLIGDVALLKAEPDEAMASELGTVVIYAGSKFIGWHPDTPTLAVADVLEIEAAWRA